MIGGQIVPTHATAKQLSLSQDVLWTRQSPVVCSSFLSGLLRRLRLATTDRHVSLLHAKLKKRGRSQRWQHQPGGPHPHTPAVAARQVIGLQWPAIWILTALGPELTAVLSKAFQPSGPFSLPADITEGRVTLLYKGNGADRAQPASYRPITPLNADYKLAARVIASRLGPLLNHVVDSTQTGFLPQQWIGDNILAHLEIIDCHQHSQQPGVLLFLFFEKAFDRLDRPWMERCMAAGVFGAGAQRWVSHLHAGTTAKVAFNGWHTARFPVQSGVFQSSPLSPLL